MSGRVFLVGAGPGDPRLITLRGAECLRAADVVLYDALAAPRLLQLAPVHAERILVGKRAGQIAIAQDEIERMIVEHARAGRTVVRLKGGDPFIFGRGGEEAEACRDAGIAYEVVPGVTSAVAAPAYAGIPLTHREHASSVTFITGRPGDGEAGTKGTDWDAIANSGGTIVFLMAVLSFREISARLIEAGMSAETPVAAVQWGTTAKQRTIKGVLASMGELIEAHHVRPPAVIVVGGVAALAGSLDWYASLPLAGTRIVVTRAREQAGELAALLEAAGAEIVEFPVIEIRKVAGAEAERLARSYREAGAYDWIVLTSVNGADGFFNGYIEAGHDLRSLGTARLAAIGPATAARIEARGIRVAAQPGEYRAEALLESLGDVRNKKVLIARARDAREVLPEELRKRGADVDVVPVYHTTVPDPPPDPAVLGQADAVTFTSSSTVTNFLAVAGDEGRALLGSAVTAAIGPITAATLRKSGAILAGPDVVPDDYTVPALADALIGFIAKRKSVP